MFIRFFNRTCIFCSRDSFHVDLLLLIRLVVFRPFNFGAAPSTNGQPFMFGSTAASAPSQEAPAGGAFAFSATSSGPSAPSRKYIQARRRNLGRK